VGGTWLWCALGGWIRIVLYLLVVERCFWLGFVVTCCDLLWFCFSYRKLEMKNGNMLDFLYSKFENRSL